MELHLAALRQAGIPVDARLKHQEDADTLRREHLVYWANLIEEYHSKTGKYPFSQTAGGKLASFVAIATPTQERLRIQENLADDRFNNIPFEDFLSELELGVRREVAPKFDPSEDAKSMPIYYSYFAGPDGYLIYSTCRSCGVTEISTLLLFGPTLPSLNIASPGMLDQVYKAQSLEGMTSHPKWELWDSYGFHDEAAIRLVEKKMIEEAGYGPAD